LSEELIAPFRVLPVLLIIAQPKSGINAEENENQFGYLTSPAEQEIATAQRVVFA
jgi:hypothetical protein